MEEKIVPPLTSPPTQEPELYSGKDQFIFIPVNWNQAKGDFDIFANAGMKELKKKYLDVYKREFPLLDGDKDYLNSGFEAINLTNCINICRFEKEPKISDLQNACVNRCLDKKLIYDPTPTLVGISNDKEFGGGLQESTSVLVSLPDLNMVSTVVHEVAHLFWLLCDEYSYKEWQWQDEDNRKTYGRKGCANPYPPTCVDHPKWVNNKEGYLTYVRGLGLTWGGYKQATEEEGTAFCSGAVCTPQAGYDQCRSVMGPVYSPDDIAYYFGGKLETRIPIEALQQ